MAMAAAGAKPLFTGVLAMQLLRDRSMDALCADGASTEIRLGIQPR